MTERERLVELLVEAEKKCDAMQCCKDCPEWEIENDCEKHLLADHLLANGVIVPKCKIDDTIYRVGGQPMKVHEWQVAYIEVYPDEIGFVDDSDNYFSTDDIGKTVFLTKESALQALKERERE